MIRFCLINNMLLVMLSLMINKWLAYDLINNSGRFIFMTIVFIKPYRIVSISPKSMAIFVKNVLIKISMVFPLDKHIKYTKISPFIR